MRLSFRILLTFCFCFVFLVTWTLPVLLIVLGGTDSASLNVGIWTYETLKLISISIERQFKFSSTNGESVRNFTRINDLPFNNNITYRSFVNRAFGEMLDSPNWQQYFPYFRFRDGSSFKLTPRSADIASLQLCRTSGIWNNSIGLPNTSYTLQAVETVSDCLLYDLNRTDHTAAPTANYEYALARTYVNGPLWLSLNKVFTPPSPMANATYYYLSPFYSPNKFERMLVILGLVLRMPNGVVRLMGSESLSINNMREILRDVLLPSVNDPRTRGYLLDPGGRCVATTHEQPYDEFGNLTIPALMQYSVTPLCFIEDTTRSAACFYNISTHPTLELLRLAGADRKNQPMHEGHAELVQRPSDGVEYFWQHTVITYSAFVKFPLYIFIPRDWVMGAIDRSKIISIVINVVLAGVGAALVYLILTPIVRVIEDLCEKLAKDPFDPELAAEMENSVARLEAKGEGEGSPYAISSSSSFSDSNKVSDEFNSDDDEQQNMNSQEDDDENKERTSVLPRAGDSKQNENNRIKNYNSKRREKPKGTVSTNDCKNRRTKSRPVSSLVKGTSSNDNERESKKSSSSSRSGGSASTSHFSINFLGIVSCCHVDFAEILTLQTAFLEMRRVISLLRSFMPERRPGIEFESSTNTSSDMLTGDSSSGSASESSKNRPNDTPDHNIPPSSPTRKMPPPLAHNTTNDKNETDNSHQESASVTKDDPTNKTGGSVSGPGKNKKAVRFDFGVSNTNDTADSDAAAAAAVTPESTATSTANTVSIGNTTSLIESDKEENPMDAVDEENNNNEHDGKNKFPSKQGLEKFPKKAKKNSLNDFGHDESVAPTHRYLVSVVRVRVPVMEYFEKYNDDNKRKRQDSNGSAAVSGDESIKNKNNNSDDDDYSTSSSDNDDHVDRETRSPKHPINDLEREHRQEKRLGHKLNRSDDDNNINDFDNSGALEPGENGDGGNLIKTDSGNYVVTFSKKTKKERRLQALIDETMFAVRVIDKKVLQPTGASLIEYRNNFFIIALRLARKNFHSRLASRFVECLMEASEILAKHYNKMEVRRDERKQRRDEKQRKMDAQQQKNYRGNPSTFPPKKPATADLSAVMRVRNHNINHDDDDNPTSDSTAKQNCETSTHTFVSEEESSLVGDEMSSNAITDNNNNSNKVRGSSNLGKAAGLFLTAGISVGYARILSFDTNNNNANNTPNKNNNNIEKNIVSSMFTKEIFLAAGYDVSNDDSDGIVSAAAAFNLKNASLPLRPFTLVGNIVSKAFECERHIRKHVESFAAATPQELSALLAAQAKNKYRGVDAVEVKRKNQVVEKAKKETIKSFDEAKDHDDPHQLLQDSIPRQQQQKESFMNANAASDGLLISMKHSSVRSDGTGNTISLDETFNNDDNEKNNTNSKNSTSIGKSNAVARLINPLYFLPYAICHHADSTHQVAKMKVCFLPSGMKPTVPSTLDFSTSTVKFSCESRFVRVFSCASAWKDACSSLSGGYLTAEPSEMFANSGFDSGDEITISETVAARKLRRLFGMEGRDLLSSANRKQLQTKKGEK